MTWVLPNILTDEDVVNLSDEVLKELTKISTGIVIKYVNSFINDNINSNNPVSREAAVKLQNAYLQLNKTVEYLNSKDARDFADTLSKLQYSDIAYDTDLEVLKLWRTQIIDLLSEDEDFRKSYTGDMSDSETLGMKTAYTTKLDKDNLNDTVSRITGIAIATGCTKAANVLVKREITCSPLSPFHHSSFHRPIPIQTIQLCVRLFIRKTDYRIFLEDWISLFLERKLGYQQMNGGDFKYGLTHCRYKQLYLRGVF